MYLFLVTKKKSWNLQHNNVQNRTTTQIEQKPNSALTAQTYSTRVQHQKKKEASENIHHIWTSLFQLQPPSSGCEQRSLVGPK